MYLYVRTERVRAVATVSPADREFSRTMLLSQGLLWGLSEAHRHTEKSYGFVHESSAKFSQTKVRVHVHVHVQ